MDDSMRSSPPPCCYQMNVFKSLGLLKSAIEGGALSSTKKLLTTLVSQWE